MALLPQTKNFIAASYVSFIFLFFLLLALNNTTLALVAGCNWDEKTLIFCRNLSSQLAIQFMVYFPWDLASFMCLVQSIFNSLCGGGGDSLKIDKPGEVTPLCLLTYLSAVFFCLLLVVEAALLIWGDVSQSSPSLFTIFAHSKRVLRQKKNSLEKD